MDNTAAASATNASQQTDPGHIACQTPILQIAKTPDVQGDPGGLITAGDTATFTIVVTNLGPGTAKSVTISDALPTGGGVTWTTASTGCTITGSNPQVLSCNLGDMAANTAKTVVVTAATSLGKCAQMDNTAATSATNASQQTTGHILCQTPIHGARHPIRSKTRVA
jgi:uncharacterized repeat protein (TIGR01451 family)